ncbi:hypothetical protein FRC12_004617 [Ceratobasidium sp. 428]|nr:hypothetical protein FRC12_004617 [Ceratobasidium sp. 428]
MSTEQPQPASKIRRAPRSSTCRFAVRTERSHQPLTQVLPPNPLVALLARLVMTNGMEASTTHTELSAAAQLTTQCTAGESVMPFPPLPHARRMSSLLPESERVLYRFSAVNIRWTPRNACAYPADSSRVTHNLGD